MIERILLAVSETGHAEEMLKVLKELPSIQQTSRSCTLFLPKLLSES